jgi:hypothetical protein
VADDEKLHGGQNIRRFLPPGNLSRSRDGGWVALVKPGRMVIG